MMDITKVSIIQDDSTFRVARLGGRFTHNPAPTVVQEQRWFAREPPEDLPERPTFQPPERRRVLPKLEGEYVFEEGSGVFDGRAKRASKAGETDGGVG